MLSGLGLSLLDRSRTRAGDDDAPAARGTVDRVRSAERLGYDRLQVAEHHGVLPSPGNAVARLAPSRTWTSGTAPSHSPAQL